MYDSICVYFCRVKWASPEFSYTTIDHKYMIPGHSNDRDFGSIEKANRRSPHIFVPEDWVTLVERATSKNPFHVTQMTTSDFVSTEAIQSKIEKVEWLCI